MLSVKQIMLQNIDQVTDKDGLFQPTDVLLDMIWCHALETTANRGMLMSDVVNGDEAIDDHLIKFAFGSSIDDAAKLRDRAQELFRDHAHSLAEEYESDVMDAINAPPEPEPDDADDNDLPF